MEKGLSQIDMCYDIFTHNTFDCSLYMVSNEKVCLDYVMVFYGKLRTKIVK